MDFAQYHYVLFTLAIKGPMNYCDIVEYLEKIMHHPFSGETPSNTMSRIIAQNMRGKERDRSGKFNNSHYGNWFKELPDNYYTLDCPNTLEDKCNFLRQARYNRPGKNDLVFTDNDINSLVNIFLPNDPHIDRQRILNALHAELRPIPQPLENPATETISKKEIQETHRTIPYNRIFTGVPGTGKTFKARLDAEKIIRAEQGDIQEQIEFVQFHPSYDYTDFVEGLRPTKPDSNGNIGFRRQDGIFKQFCKKALSKREKHFFFIIDEINRGDISKIFGELFFAIDPNYRGTKGRIKTQFSNLLAKDDVFKDGFFVPDNVYIIGTMNDIDRSVECMDFAIRRRFQWIEIKAADTKADIFSRIPTEYREQASRYFDRLNQAIDECESLGSAFEVGAAYFLNIKDANGDFRILWNEYIAPLVREYLRGTADESSAFEIIETAYFGTAQE